MRTRGGSPFVFVRTKLSAGKFADVIAVPGDPLRHIDVIANTRAPRGGSGTDPLFGSVFGRTLGAVHDEDIDLLLVRIEPQAELFPCSCKY